MGCDPILRSNKPARLHALPILRPRVRRHSRDLHRQLPRRRRATRRAASRGNPFDRRPHRRPSQDRRLLPALLGRPRRDAASRDPALRQRLPILHRAVRRLGSNDIGLDRGGGGQGRVVRFHRVGPKIMLVQPNQSFRSSAAIRASGSPSKSRSRKSILWGFTVAAETNGRVLVDATPFFLRDIHGAGRGAASRHMARRSRRAARSICRTRGISRRTPKST